MSTFSEVTNIASPPPPYSTNPPPKTSDTQPNRPDHASGFPEYPAQAHHTQAPARTLHIDYGNCKATRIDITDSDEQKPLYNIKLKMTKPQMTFESASTRTPIATVIFHTLHSRIDTIIHDSLITMTTHLSFKSVYTYASPALQGATLSWKSRNTTFDLECVDEKGVVVARFHFSRLSMKKAGRLELVDVRVCDDGNVLLEELMVTGLAFAYYMQALWGAVVS